ncbi:MAG: hypothetical protein R3C28_15040 [Pirellulaceae bacterium]
MIKLFKVFVLVLTIFWLGFFVGCGASAYNEKLEQSVRSAGSASQVEEEAADEPTVDSQDSGQADSDDDDDDDQDPDLDDDLLDEEDAEE